MLASPNHAARRKHKVVNVRKIPALKGTRASTHAIVDGRPYSPLAINNRKRRTYAPVIARSKLHPVDPIRRIIAPHLGLPDGICSAAVRAGVAIAPAYSVVQGRGLIIAPGLTGGAAGRGQGRYVADDADTGVGVGLEA